MWKLVIVGLVYFFSSCQDSDDAKTKHGLTGGCQREGEFQILWIRWKRLQEKLQKQRPKRIQSRKQNVFA